MAKGLTRVYFVSCAFFRGKEKTVAAIAFSLFLLRLVNDSEQCCTGKAHEPFVCVILLSMLYTNYAFYLGIDARFHFRCKVIYNDVGTCLFARPKQKHGRQ